MKTLIFLGSFQEKLLEDSALAISFAGFSKNLIKKSEPFHRGLILKLALNMVPRKQKQKQSSETYTNR